MFVTWRLHGSTPSERPFTGSNTSSGAAFAAFDRLLDAASAGPTHLGRAEIAVLVEEQLRRVSGSLCVLHAYAIMPNHVHVLCTPLVSLSTLVRKIKGPTAAAANGLLGLKGQPFWQAEYFDRLVRNDQEFEKIRGYIEGNPVKAGLAAQPENYRWCSAWGAGRG